MQIYVLHNHSKGESKHFFICLGDGSLQDVTVRNVTYSSVVVVLISWMSSLVGKNSLKLPLCKECN